HPGPTAPPDPPTDTTTTDTPAPDDTSTDTTVTDDTSTDTTGADDGGAEETAAPPNGHANNLPLNSGIQTGTVFNPVPYGEVPGNTPEVLILRPGSGRI